MKTVALVGKCARNWKMAPFDNVEIPVWGISYWAALGKYPRVDAVFEVHKPWVWKHAPTTEDFKPGYYVNWLKESGFYPIFMRASYPDIPTCVPYPMKQVQAKFFKNLYHGKDLVGRFFTSTIAYMLGLALFYGYERIEIYGVEMNVEQYQYQRDSFFWWTGLANGLGVEIVVPDNSELFIVDHYGDQEEPKP
jgi:hypothetical protein